MRAPAIDRLSDAELMERIRERDEEALAAVYDRYSGLLYTFVLRLCKERALAEEMLQDIFATLWQTAELWDPGRGSLQAWLVTMGRNKAIDALRSRSRSEALPLTTDMRSTDEGPDEVALQRIINHEVKRALEQLPARYRDILEAVYFRGLTQREAAEKFGLPHGTVKSRIRLAIERLKRTLRARGIQE